MRGPPPGLDHQGELLGLGIRRQPGLAAVADAVLAGQVGHQLSHRLRLGCSEMGPPSVQMLVGRQLLRLVLGKHGE